MDDHTVSLADDGRLQELLQSGVRGGVTHGDLGRQDEGRPGVHQVVQPGRALLDGVRVEVVGHLDRTQDVAVEAHHLGLRWDGLRVHGLREDSDQLLLRSDATAVGRVPVASQVRGLLVGTAAVPAGEGSTLGVGGRVAPQYAAAFEGLAAVPAEEGSALRVSGCVVLQRRRGAETQAAAVADEGPRRRRPRVQQAVTFEVRPRSELAAAGFAREQRRRPVCPPPVTQRSLAGGETFVALVTRHLARGGLAPRHPQVGVRLQVLAVALGSPEQLLAVLASQRLLTCNTAKLTLALARNCILVLKS